MNGGTGRDTLYGASGDDDMSGGPDNDRLLGADGDDTLRGDAGDDVLYGQAGDDVLDGGPGTDELIDGSGNNRFIDEGRAGQGGNLSLLQWQAPSTANPMLSGASTDALAASLVLEPLALTAPDGSLVPVLATDIPTVANGGVSSDLTRITWQLQDGLLWSDGTPVTSRDVGFTFLYCTTVDTGCTSLGNFDGVTSVIANDPQTVTVTFDAPTPYPWQAFVGSQSPIIQRAQFVDCVGTAAPGCAENLMPIGTGPYMVTEFRPNDSVRYEWNPSYRKANAGLPFFSTVEIAGGGDAESTARSVLELGLADRAWNTQVAPEVLAAMEAVGNGQVLTGFTSQVEHVHLNQTNPDADGGSDYRDGTNPHPLLFDDPRLAQALSMAIDRDALVAAGYGPSGEPACNIWNVPAQASPNNDFCPTQDIAGANALLDGLGYLDTNNDGVREKNGQPLSFDFVTSENAVRQATQALIEGDWAEIGVEVEMRAEPAFTFFDGSHPASIWRFPSDMQMFTNLPDSPDAFRYLTSWSSEQIPESANAWSGSNFSRLSDPDLDAALEELSAMPPTDPAYRDLVIRINDIISWESGSTIPLVHRGSTVALSNEIKGHGAVNGWDSQYWNIEEWYRD